MESETFSTQLHPDGEDQDCPKNLNAPIQQEVV